MFLKSVTLTSICMLLLALVLFTLPVAGEVDRSGTENSFWLWPDVSSAQVPSGATGGMAQYLRFARMREAREGLTPLLISLQGQGVITGFEPGSLPPFVKVTTLLTESSLRSRLPGGLSVASVDSLDVSVSFGQMLQPGPSALGVAPAASGKLVAWLTEDMVSGTVQGVTQPTTVTVSVVPPPGRGAPYARSITSAANGDYAVEFYSTLGRDIAPGDAITVTAPGAPTRSLVVPNMTLNLDLTSQTLTGTQPVGYSTVAWVQDYERSWNHTYARWVGPISVPSASITYTVSPPPGVDLDRADNATLNSTNLNGDEAIVTSYSFFARTYSHKFQGPAVDKIDGYLNPWATALLTLSDAGGPIHWENVSGGNTGYFSWESSGNETNLDSGRRVTIGSMAPVEIPDISLSVDVQNDVVTASLSNSLESTAGRFVRMQINQSGFTRDGTTDSQGQVTIDFSTVGDSSNIDIMYGHTVTVIYEHSSGHQSAFIFDVEPPAPTPTLTPTVTRTATPTATVTPVPSYRIHIPIISTGSN